MKNIRNFSIIAHIDHGKSTLADRFLQITNAIDSRKFQNQALDSLDIERERGITVKSQAVRLNYINKKGEHYIFNLIDTPGHVDFSYEVSRSLAACEGALLIVDVMQGVEAQTIANLYLALENNLTIIPVINKIDIEGADAEETSRQIEKTLGMSVKDIAKISAKNGLGIEDLLEKTIDIIPPPSGNAESPLQALIFDSYYDTFRATVIIIRVFNGTVKPGDSIHFIFTGKTFIVEEVGYQCLGRFPLPSLSAGEVGYIIAGIKSVSDIKIGDTVTLTQNPAEPLKGYKEVKPMVFAGIYPIDTGDFEDLKVAIEKLKLNDSSLQYEPHNSQALGFGFRCGFLGLLHMEIVQERLRREFNMDIINTAPTVCYKIEMRSGQTIEVDNPAHFPSSEKVERYFEPYVKASIITPREYLGSIMQLVMEKRGIQKNLQYLDERKVEVYYEIPLAEIIFDFYDKLKSCTKGYASFDYEPIDYREVNLVKVDILVNGEKVDALSFLTHEENSRLRSRVLTEKLKELIPRHMFQVPIQAAIGAKIIARENISAMRKNVIAKCYGGDISRKRKLLEKQKEGKKKMKSVGSVSIPQEAFIAVLKSN